MSRSDRPQWTPGGTDAEGHRCRNCGAHVLPRTPKVLGDSNDVLWHCTHCPGISLRDLKYGAGTDPDYDPAEDRGRSAEQLPIFSGAGGDDQ